MKEIFIKDLLKYCNQEINISVLVKEITESSNRLQNQWQDVIITDASGDAALKLWAENMSEEYYNYVGKVVDVLGRVTLYQSRPVIEAANLSPKEVVSWKDYVIMLDEKKKETFVAYIKEKIAMVKKDDVRLGNLLAKIFTKNRIEEMAKCPGGEKEHNYFGALLEHTVDVCERAIDLIVSYDKAKAFKPYGSNINKSLVIAAALLHDVGKLNYFCGFPKVCKSQRGRLIESKVDSILFTTMLNNSLENKVLDLAPLNHIILTADSNNEYMQQPITIEAIIVNQANLDSVKMDLFDSTFFEYDRICATERDYIYSKKAKQSFIRSGKESKLC